MLFVFERSRPGSHACDDVMAAASWPCVAGSASTMASSSADATSRWSARRTFCAFGSIPAGATRMRSMADNASSGRVSHDGDRASHSFGPRLPNSWRKASNSFLNATASAEPLVDSLASTSCTSPSKIDVNSGDALTLRPIAHIAMLGAAESTSPMPEMMVIIRSGRPTAFATAVMMPTGRVARNDVKMCSPNSGRCSTTSSSKRAHSARSSSDDRSGRSLRMRFVSSRCSVRPSRSLRQVCESTQPNVAPTFSLRSGRTSPGIST